MSCGSASSIIKSMLVIVLFLSCFMGSMSFTSAFQQVLKSRLGLAPISSRLSVPSSSSPSSSSSSISSTCRSTTCNLKMTIDPSMLCGCGVCGFCAPGTDFLSSMPLSDAGYGGGIEGTNLSLYFTLALYVLTLPGLYSLVTRSVKVKDVQKNYDLPGPANTTAKTTRQVAGEIMAYFKALNYEITAAEDVITFKGVMGKSKSQAAFLTFCTFVGLGSLGLVLSILNQDIGSKAYALTLLSPYAGIFYWNNAQRIDTVKVKMETSDDEQLITVTAQGGKEDIERFAKTLQLPERGKVYMKGIFEDEALPTEVTELVKDKLAEVTVQESVETSDEVKV